MSDEEGLPPGFHGYAALGVNVGSDSESEEDSEEVQSTQAGGATDIADRMLQAMQLEYESVLAATRTTDATQDEQASVSNGNDDHHAEEEEDGSIFDQEPPAEPSEAAPAPRSCSPIPKDKADLIKNISKGFKLRADIESLCDPATLKMLNTVDGIGQAGSWDPFKLAGR